MTDGDQGDLKGGTGDQKIMVGEKEYTAQDVENLLSISKASNEKSQKVTKVLDVCAKYDMEPEDFAAQAVGAFGIINNLMQDEIIDAQGNVKAKKEVKKTVDDGLGDLFNLDGTPKKKTPVGDEGVAAIVAKALGPIVEKFDKGLGDVKDIQTSMIRSNYQKEIIGKYSNLDAEDVSRVFGVAMQDRTKDIWDVAKSASEAKEARQVEANKSFAEKHGLNYEDLVKKASEKDENDLNEQSSEGGAAALSKDKKISFRTKSIKGLEDSVDPLDLAQEYLKKVEGG